MSFVLRYGALSEQMKQHWMHIMEYCDILALSVLAFGFDTCFLSLSISFLLAKSTKTMQNELFKKVKYECTTMRELQFHLVFGFIDFVEHTQLVTAKTTEVYEVKNKCMCNASIVTGNACLLPFTNIFCVFASNLCRFVYAFFSLCFHFLSKALPLSVSFLITFRTYFVLYLPMNVLVILYSRFFMRSRRFCLLFDFLFHTLAEDRKKITQQNKTTAPKANGYKAAHHNAHYKRKVTILTHYLATKGMRVLHIKRC